MAATRADPILSKVLYCLRHGWPKKVPDFLTPVWHKRRVDHRGGLHFEGDEGCHSDQVSFCGPVGAPPWPSRRGTNEKSGSDLHLVAKY